MEATLTPELVPVKDAVWQRISELDAQLKANDPKMMGHCGAIQKELSQYEELVHLLSDDQIRQIMIAQKQVTGTMLVQKVVKTTSKTSLAKQAKYDSVDDL